jgi:hypothetical protein
MEKPVLSTEQMDNLCYASYQLLQTMSNIYGSDPAYEMFQKLEEVLGQEVKSNLFLRMLESSFTGAGPLHFKFYNGHCLNVINMIKSAREYGVDENRNRLGLKDAKDIIDSARHNGKGTLHFLSNDSRKAFLVELKANNGQTI